jgi:hypothetical protein
MRRSSLRQSNSAPGDSNLKHRQFETELRAGRFAATSADLDTLDLPAHFDDSAIGPPPSRVCSRQLTRMRLYMTDPECRGIAIRAQERAERLALATARRFPVLFANAGALSDQHRVPPPAIAGGRGGTEGIKRDIRELEAEIARLRAKNAELGRHLDLLTKAQETLVFEECALLSLAGMDRVALDFEHRRQKQQDTLKTAIHRLEARAAPPE